MCPLSGEQKIVSGKHIIKFYDIKSEVQGRYNKSWTHFSGFVCSQYESSDMWRRRSRLPYENLVSASGDAQRLSTMMEHPTGKLHWLKKGSTRAFKGLKSIKRSISHQKAANPVRLLHCLPQLRKMCKRHCSQSTSRQVKTLKSPTKSALNKRSKIPLHMW